MPDISVAMGTYNGAQFILPQLESLAAQRHLPAELQVGDDGSTDDTVAIVERFAERAPFPVHVERNVSQLGFGENFLRTAKRCRGDWIAFCDQDDYWHPDKLAVCARAIDARPDDLTLVVHQAVLGDAELRPIGRLDKPPAGLYPPLSLPPEWVCQGMRQVVKASIFERFSTEERAMAWHLHPTAHDAWTCLFSSIAGTIRVLPDALLTYRRHDGNVTLPTPSDDGVRSMWLRPGAALADDSAQYRETACLMYTIAQYVHGRAALDSDAAEVKVFQNAARSIKRRGHALELRATVQGGGSFPVRMTAFVDMILGRYYAATHTSSIQWKSMIKDFVISFHPTKR